MTEPVSKGTAKSSGGMGGYQGSGSIDVAAEYKKLSPKFVGAEDRLTPAQAEAAWAKMLRAVGFSAPNEDVRKMLRYGVYVYLAKNGTSRVGNYSRPIELADGTEVDSAVIPGAVGERRIRQFMRACMVESYEYFKGSGVMEQDDGFVARAEKLGFPPEVAFAMADWLTDCPLFTPQENRCHEAARLYGLERAARSRGGKKLEDVERAALDHDLKVQGPAAMAEDSEF